MAMTQAVTASKPTVAGTTDAYGVEFNDQWLVADIPTGLEGASAFTFALWFQRLSAWPDTIPPIFQITVDAGSTTSGAGLSYGGGSKDEIQFTETGGLSPGDSNYAYVDASVAPIGTWVHLAGVWASESQQIFVNGVASGVTASRTASIAADLSTYRVSIGAARDGSRPVHMLASNLQIWNVALTAQQIQDWSMKRIETPFQTGLIFYAPL